MAVRDWLLFCLLADHGLHCSEIAGLSSINIDISTGLLKFYRRRVHKWQIHRLTPDTLAAAQVYDRRHTKNPTYP